MHKLIFIVSNGNKSSHCKTCHTVLVEGKVALLFQSISFGHPILLLANVAHLFQRVAKVSEVALPTYMLVAFIFLQLQKLSTSSSSSRHYHLYSFLVAKMLPSYSSNCKSCPSIPVAARVAPPILVVSSLLIPLVAQVAYIFQYLQLLTHSIFILALHERTHNASYRKIRKSNCIYSFILYIVGENDSKYLEDQRPKLFFL